ncbi:MAG: rhodanese-like domain-containing protein [Candidatus Binatia bacterium]|jgi:rhodanese-related sulfurtransferase
MISEISVTDLSRRIAGPDAPVVLDVREPQEIAIARFPGAVEIPMQSVPSRMGELDRNAEIFVLCHHGMRSAHVADYLAEQGFTRVGNVTGGIDAWALMVDPSVPRY